jgi:hypothetical protein
VNAGGAGVFLGFLGNLDAAGQASATFQVPPGNLFAGRELDFAFLTVDPLAPSAIESLSNSVHVSVQ